MKVFNHARRPVKAWVDGVEFCSKSFDQVTNIADMPFIHKHVAIMPDVHLGKGATVGSVIPTKGAIIPAAVGVDIGCGMMAVKTSLTAEQLPDSLKGIYDAIAAVVPTGFNQHQKVSDIAKGNMLCLADQFDQVVEDYRWKRDHTKLRHKLRHQLGTLGGGNHFLEICLDTNDDVWVMLHSGSRGIGNILGSHFISQAKHDMKKYFVNLPDQDLSYIPEGSPNFEPYCLALDWAQRYAAANRKVMMKLALLAITPHLPKFELMENAINCHHNYVAKENHFGQNVWVTRKGAVSARKGQLGIIPGSMGAKSFIVRGLGNKDSFCSCSHGAGRVMSRTEAKKRVSVEEHVKATEGVECRKDQSVLDETPKAYKDIDAVMAAQGDLVEIVYQLKQVMCLKG